jgi:ribosome-binding factor A
VTAVVRLALAAGAQARAWEQCVTRRNRRRMPTAGMDQIFVDALAAAGGSSASRERQGERKMRQLCRQVQRAVNLALADGRADVDDLFVESVTAGQGGPLLLHVVVPADRAVGEVLAALQRDGPRLRCDVARAITRKRAPELAFVPVPGGGGHDE